MLVAVIPVSLEHPLEQQIALAHTHADAIEFRLDYAKKMAITAIRSLRETCRIPVIFTLRKKSQGGLYPRDEAERLNDLFTLCALNPDYIDLEYDTSQAFLEKIKSHFPHIKIICSYHDFEKTPDNLQSVLSSMLNPHCDLYKLVTFAQSGLDALRMMQFVLSQQHPYLLTGLCMGSDGQCTRILSPVYGNVMHYAAINPQHATAPGQLTLETLISHYCIKQLNAATSIYALMGDPVEMSVGHILHNQAIQYLQKNAAYIKLHISSDELPKALILCRELKFKGLSITMPLKEKIVPLLDEIDSASHRINAINSVIYVKKKYKEKYSGFNTDGKGAIQALLSYRPKLNSQKIILLGAGGAARAIAYQARQHHASVLILNRSLDKSTKLAQEMGCEADHLHRLTDIKNTDYHIMINTLPEHVFLSPDINSLLHSDLFSSQTIAMDSVYQPIHTLFLQIAKRANSICIPGYEMYINQALLQIQTWFDPSKKQLDDIKNNMREYFGQT